MTGQKNQIHSDHKELSLLDMIKLFRVQDLKELCAFVSLPKSGLKQTLLERCMKISLSDENIRKIKEIYNELPLRIKSIYMYRSDQMWSETSINKVEFSRAFDSSSSTDMSTHTLTDTSIDTPIDMPSDTPSDTPIDTTKDLSKDSSNSSSIDTSKNPSTNSSNSSSIDTSKDTSKNPSTNSSIDTTKDVSNDTPADSRTETTHVLILDPSHLTQKANIEKKTGDITMKQFRPLAFYDLNKTIVETTELKNLFGKSTSFSLNHFTLNLPYIPTSAFKNYIRFGYIDKETNSKFIEDSLPHSLSVSFNSRSISLPEATKLTQQREAVRPYEPLFIDISKQEKNENQIKVFWKNYKHDTRTFYICVQQLVPKSLTDIIKTLESSSILPREATFKMIRDKLVSEDTDFQIETSTLNVSLLCPLLNSRMSLPGRANSCKHLQCFDLKSYLMLNEKNAKWQCPVCRQNAYLEDLHIDDVMRDILSVTSAAIHEVNFDKNGWPSVKEAKSGSEGYISEEEVMDIDTSIIDLCDSFQDLR